MIYDFGPLNRAFPEKNATRVSENEGGRVKGRLELSRKFIPFDSFFSLGLLIPVTRPLKQAVLQKTPTSDSDEVP